MDEFSIFFLSAYYLSWFCIFIFLCFSIKSMDVIFCCNILNWMSLVCNSSHFKMLLWWLYVAYLPSYFHLLPKIRHKHSVLCIHVCQVLIKGLFRWYHKIFWFVVFSQYFSSDLLFLVSLAFLLSCFKWRIYSLWTIQFFKEVE